MENKINIAELLRDCPKGMELDCIIWDSEVKVFLKRVLNDDFTYPIEVTIKYNNTECTKSFTKYGAFNDLSYCKCIIFPKGKTTWEGFVPPCQFKDGDIISDSLGTCIFKGEGIIQGTVDYYCGINSGYFDVKDNECRPDGHYGNIVYYRLATEEEKEKLFQVIKDNGYKWNAETKTLEKLIEPKFKVGDRVRHKTYTGETNIVTEIKDTHYILDDELALPFISQDDYELFPNKFDINTLVPFESRVLVRAADNQYWRPAIWGVKQGDWDFYCVLGGEMWEQCIPYEGNEYLLGKTDDCEEYYKTWE